jgi:hypothetical protein
MRIFVDGIDVVPAAYGPGGFGGKPVAGSMPSRLLGPHGLTASPEVREVALGGSDTTEDQLTVRIRQIGTTVIWDRWRMVQIETVTKEGPDVGLGTFHFDARAYASELARATARADRRWPARTVAELLQDKLRREPDGDTWIRGNAAVRAPEDRPEVVEISYYARDTSGLRYAMPGRYVVTFPIGASDPEHQAQTIAHRLYHEDLKPASVHRPRQRRH